MLVRGLFDRCVRGLGVAAVLAAAPAAAETVTLATLTWPPYTGRELPAGGAVTDVVKRVFAKAGHETRVVYRPWNRAIVKAKRPDNGVVGYYPGYHCRHDPSASFHRSGVLGIRPIGFAKRDDAPFSWSDLEDLEGFRIGTVVGYANTRAFDRKAEAQELWTIPAQSDRANLRKLTKGLLNYAVIDRNVLSYLMSTDPKLREHRGEITMAETPLGEMPLFVCFRDSERGRRLLRTFNETLGKLEAREMLKARMKELMADVRPIPQE